MDVPCDMLLHPELLTNEQLKYIIEQRQLHIPNLNSMDRDDLLAIFHQYCVPYGQRRYRDSGRGKLLNKTRKMSPESKCTINTLNTLNSHKINSNSSQNRKISLIRHHDRIRPPPDLLSGHIKRIRLDSSKEKIESSNKRRMSVDEVPQATDSPPPKKGKKPITWP